MMISPFVVSGRDHCGGRRFRTGGEGAAVWFRPYRRGTAEEEACGRGAVQVLGPLEATRAGAPVALGGPRSRVLAALLLAGGHQFALTRWSTRLGRLAPGHRGEDRAEVRLPAAGPARHSGLIVSGADGYRLVTADVDSRHFEALVAEGMDERSPERAAAALTRALELWRGEPYPDLPDLAPAQAERRRLVEQRIAAIEALAGARLALGQHTAMIGWLDELVAARCGNASGVC